MTVTTYQSRTGIPADSLNLADYTALRAYGGPGTSAYVTGYLVTAAPSGIAGEFTRDDSDTTSADNGGTIIVDVLDRRWKRVFDGPVSKDWFDDIGAAIDYANSSGFHRRLAVPAGRHTSPTALVVNAATDGTSTTDHRNFSLIGEGGMGTEYSSEIRGTLENSAASVLGINSTFGARVESVALTSTAAAVLNVLRVDADDGPAFSGLLNVFDGVYTNSFTATPADAVVRVVNQKNVEWKNSWLGVRAAGNIALKMGGLAADNGSKLQEGELNCFHLHNNYVFGKAMAERVLNFQLTNNAFIESYQSSVGYSTGGIMAYGAISYNYFTGIAGDANNNTGIDTAPPAGTIEDSGCLTIECNRFRYRPVGVNVQTTRPIRVSYNFARVESGNVFIEIQSTAEKVTVGPNDFSHVQATNGAYGIRDLRHTFGTDAPTANVDKDIVADWVLSADFTLAGGNNTTQEIGSVSPVFLRGGKYRIRAQVSARNSHATEPLNIEWMVRYVDTANVTHHIGIRGTAAAPTTGIVIASSAKGTGYVERIVYLPPTVTKPFTTSAFKIYARNLSVAANGFVDGGGDELNGDFATWFQVEEYRD
jgi:hypothetical protein